MRSHLKYRNKKTNGFSSKREANRYAELKALNDAGIIKELQTQIRFEVLPKQDGERAVHYIADFAYFDEKGVYVVEDTKGFKTLDYVIKRKLMLFTKGIKVQEI